MPMSKEQAALRRKRKTPADKIADAEYYLQYKEACRITGTPVLFPHPCAEPLGKRRRRRRKNV